MQPVLEVPDDAIAQHQVVVSLEEGIEHDVERDDLSRRHVVPDLPADAAAGTEHADALVDHAALAVEIVGERRAATTLVGLGEVIGW